MAVTLFHCYGHPIFLKRPTTTASYFPLSCPISSPPPQSLDEILLWCSLLGTVRAQSEESVVARHWLVSFYTPPVEALNAYRSKLIPINCVKRQKMNPFLHNSLSHKYYSRNRCWLSPFKLLCFRSVFVKALSHLNEIFMLSKTGRIGLMFFTEMSGRRQYVEVELTVNPL